MNKLNALAGLALFAAVFSMPMGTEANAMPIPAPVNHCCNCVGVGQDENGNTIWACPCSFTFGGDHCIIRPGQCTGEGQCLH